MKVGRRILQQRIKSFRCDADPSKEFDKFALPAANVDNARASGLRQMRHDAVLEVGRGRKLYDSVNIHDRRAIVAVVPSELGIERHIEHIWVFRAPSQLDGSQRLILSFILQSEEPRYIPRHLHVVTQINSRHFIPFRSPKRSRRVWSGLLMREQWHRNICWEYKTIFY